MELRLLTDANYSEESQIVENELIDQYLANALSAEERARFEQHFLKAPERRDKLAFAVALSEAAAARASGKRPKVVLTPTVRRAAWFIVPPLYLKAAAVIIIALSVGLGGWLLFLRRPSEDQGLAALKDAYKNRRFIESRIAGLDHAPLIVTRGQEKSGIDEDALRREELRLLLRLKERPDAEAHHALGRFYLAGLQFDKATEHLEQALRQEPDNAQIHNDLGATLLEMGNAETMAQESGEGLKYFARSRDEIGKALELNGSLLEALYNRALVRQHLVMWQQAEDDWRKYLERDSNSPWAVEAKKNLKLLEERQNKSGLRRAQSLKDFLGAYRSRDDDAAWEIYTRSHASSGNSITNALLDSYLDSQFQGSGDDALKSIHALTYLGRAELRRVGDHYTWDLAQFYNSTTTQQRAILSSARYRIKIGYELSGKAEFAAAMNNFALARQEFEQVGDKVEAAFADYAIANCCALQPDIDKGLSIFARITPACESMGYRWLLAQCLRTTAHLRDNLNDYSEAIDLSARALSMSEQLQDQDGILRSLTQIAALHQSLNDTERSLHYLLRSLLIGQEYDSAPKDSWGRYIAMSFNFNTLGYYNAALDYQREALLIAISARIPLLISRSYEYIGQTYGKLKLYGEAIEAARMAYRQGESLPGEPAGLNMMASASLQLGDIYRQAGDYAEAVSAFDKSIALYDALKFYHYSSSAHKGKLLTYLAQKNDALASEELQTVLRIFEEYRGKITDDGLRNIFFDNEQSVYDLAIDFEFSRMHDPQRAFEYSEESRARSLLHLVQNGGHVAEREHGRDVRTRPEIAPLSFSEVKGGMPDGAQLLQYAALDDKLLIWFLSGKDFFYKSVDINSKDLDNRVADYLKNVTSLSDADAEGAQKTSRALHDILIRPVEEHIDPGKLLCIVPDKVLNFVPFGALISAKSSKYLIEDYRLTLSPSSTMFTVSSSAAAQRKMSKEDETLLSVGDPSFDRQVFPRLPRLPSAAREAEEIATYYKSPPVLLLRERARASQVKAALEKSNVVHLAAHYVVDRGPNMRSKLVLARESAGGAKDGQAGGTLEPWEVYQMELPLTRLVVLSGCQTGIERQYNGEGPISFARAFIAAGVPLMVASLWTVDSDASAELMISFHRYRKRDSLPTAEALRRAQLDMLESQDPRYHRPYYWASFVTIGGYAEF